jgi:transcription initiation factor IIE alpha subunit
MREIKTGRNASSVRTTLHRKSRLEELKPNEIYVKEYKDKKKITRAYYYIDYPRAINVIKYKLYKNGKLIDNQVNQQAAAMPFKCKNLSCECEYSALDMLDLEMTIDQIPLCRYCSTELELAEQDQSVGNAEYVKFMNETSKILELLKKTEDLELHECDPILPDLNKVASVDSTPVDTPKAITNNVVVEIEENEDSTKDIIENEELNNYYEKLKEQEQVTLYMIYLCRKRPGSDLEDSSDEEENFEEI